MKRYDELLDEIFNVKFIERAMKLKAMVDCQIMVIHLHMAIIAFYDLLIYRYYTPVWNRNAEGKLKALEEKKKKKKKMEEKKMMMMMMMMIMKIKKEKINWIEVDQKKEKGLK